MNDLLHALAALVRLITEHLATVFEVGSGALFIAIVSTMPKKVPTRFQDYWDWVRDSLQTAIPATRAVHTEYPTVPVAPAQPKEQ